MWLLGQKLILLVEASRVSELQVLDLKYQIFRPEGVVFNIPTVVLYLRSLIFAHTHAVN